MSMKSEKPTSHNESRFPSASGRRHAIQSFGVPSRDSSIRRESFSPRQKQTQIKIMAEESTATSMAIYPSNASLSSEDLELTYTLSGTNTDMLTDREALNLAAQLNLKYKTGNPMMCTMQHAGVAPSRFNLHKTNEGKYVTRMVIQKKWKSQRARFYWHRIRVSVLKSAAGDYFDMCEDGEDEDFDLSLVQGFKCLQAYRRPYEIISVCHHVKIPTHYQDGALGFESADAFAVVKEKEIHDEEENFFETRKDKDLKKQKNYSIAVIDTKRNLTIWDINQQEPRFSVKMGFDISLISFLSRYYMYVGLMDRKNIKFFTFKLQITSGIMCSHDIQQLEYFANKNELIAVGTHDMSVWTLDGNVTRGDLIIQPTLRLSIHPKLREGDWIDMAFILHERKQIWIVVNTSIMIYHYENGTYLNTIKHVTARKISCIAHHAEYQYILVGSVDGTIKVINIVNASVHEFVSHSKSVVSISVFPEGPLFISCSADQTIRLFNLKYFKEICSVHLKEKPIHMGLIDDVYLYVRTRSNLQIWATNQFNVNFTTMSSSISRLIYVPDSVKPPRILARTADGVNRIVSPVTGRTITANLPLLETDIVSDVVYFSKLERLFVLLEGGEIWIFRTDQNPCTIVDIWNSDESSNYIMILESEGCILITICNALLDQEALSFCPPQLKGFAILLGATRNGHILVFGRGGLILDRYQLHFGCITQMVFDEQNSCLITAGLDDNIRISTIKPLHPNIIQIKIEIRTNFIPRLLVPMGNIIAVTSDDASIHMFEFNLARQEWKIMKGHQKMHDHTQRVNSLVCCKKMRIFVSSSLDNSVRIWNHQNKLIREILFQEPIDSLCLANENGDILLAMGNRIDLDNVVLPHMYDKARDVQIIQKESPIYFNDSLIPFTRAQTFQFRERERLVIDKYSPLEIFCVANIPWFEKVSNIRRRGIFENTNLEECKIALIGEEDGVDRILKDIVYQTRQKRMRNIPSQSFGHESSNPTDVRKTSKILDTMSVSGPLDPISELPSQKLCVKNDSFSTQCHLESKNEQNETKPTFFIAPDGAVPNSIIENEVLNWLTLKKRIIATPAQLMFKKKKKELKDKNDDDQERQRKEYQEKLRGKMKQMLQQEPLDQKETEVLQEIPLVVEEQSLKLRIGTAETPNSQTDFEPIPKPIVEYQVPDTIERFMNYDWFPEDLVFYEPGNEPKSNDNEIIFRTSKGKVTKHPKTTGTGDELCQIVLKIFPGVVPSKRGEVLYFLKWLKTDVGIENSTPLQNFVIGKLEPLKVTDSEDMRLRLQLIEWMLDINPNNTDFLFCMIPYLHSFYDNLKFKAIQVLFGMGLSSMMDPYIQQKLETILNEYKHAELSASINKKDVSILEMYEVLFRVGLRDYLMYTATDKDQAILIQNMDIYGVLDTSRANSSKKKKKKRPQTTELLNTTDSKGEADFELPERNFLNELNHQIESAALQVRQSVIEMRSVDYPSDFDHKTYPKLTFPHLELFEIESRHPSEILKMPLLVDYVDGCNFLLYIERERLKAKELKRLEELRLKKLKEEALALEQKKRAENITKNAQLAFERLKLEEARKERIRLLKLAKSLGVSKIEEKKPIRKVKFSAMQTKGIGKTHQSCCHESREVLDASYRNYGMYEELRERGFINSSLTVHLNSINKSMPIEKVELDPFNDQTKPTMRASKHAPLSRDPKIQKNPRPHTVHPIETQKELEFIRGLYSAPANEQKQIMKQEKNKINDSSLYLHTPTFQPARKFFIPSLTVVKKA